MAKKRKTKKIVEREEKEDLSDDESDQLIHDFTTVVDDLREYFFEHSPEEEGDDFYDAFLRKFYFVEEVVHAMVDNGMIQMEQETVEKEQVLNIKHKPVKGIRDDN